MNTRLRWPVVVVTLAVLATVALGSAGVSAASGSFERTLAVTGPVDLEVKTGSGSISVRTGEPGQVVVRGTIRSRDDYKVRALESNPPIEQDGNSIRIGHIEDRELRRNVSISYELLVPVETRLQSSTGSGRQAIQGVRGRRKSVRARATSPSTRSTPACVPPPAAAPSAPPASAARSWPPPAAGA
ncbi:MAG: hypothetical protein ACE5HL_00940 [Terriglobia bacterium]